MPSASWFSNSCQQDATKSSSCLVSVISPFRSDEAPRRRFRELCQQVAQDLRTDLAVVAGRELLLWGATDLATDLTVNVGAAIAARLGVSAAIVGTGAASSWVTLGVGFVVAIALDAVVDRLIKAAGYDAEESIATRVAEKVDELGQTITDGDRETQQDLAQLKKIIDEDPSDVEVCAWCRKAIGYIEADPLLLYGLRGQLSKMTDDRARLRDEVLRRLVFESVVTP